MFIVAKLGFAVVKDEAEKGAGLVDIERGTK